VGESGFRIDVDAKVRTQADSHNDVGSSITQSCESDVGAVRTAGVLDIGRPLHADIMPQGVILIGGRAFNLTDASATACMPPA
jgi:hypothetical protein